MPIPENYRRAENLRDTVRREIEGLRTGNTSRLSTLAELSRNFVYRDVSSVRGVLVKDDLLKERRLAEMETRYNLIPSIELAWIIGVLAGGSGTAKNGTIRCFSDDADLLMVFKSRGERIFKTGAKESTQFMVSFYDTELTKALGDFRRDEWPKSITSKHKWVWELEKYGWALLEGFFDQRGGFDGPQTLILSTSSKGAANFISELMTRLGLRNPRIASRTSSKEGISGVALYNLADIKMFAEHIYPVSNEKKEKLAGFRDKDVQKRFKFTDEQIIEEWLRANDLLDHSPSLRDIDRLRVEGVLSCSVIVFRNRFGEGSFRTARENLDRIVKERRGS